MRRCYGIPAFAGLVGAVASPGCQSPTEMSVQVTTDLDCASFAGATVTVGALHDIETKPPSSTATACDPATGRVGAVVFVPSGAKDQELAFKIVGGSGRPPDQCVAPAYGKGCIVARRALHFLPQHPLYVLVKLAVACDGIVCPETQTCVEGTCKDATIGNSNPCTSPTGCDEGSLGSGGSVDGGPIDGGDDATLDGGGDGGTTDGSPTDVIVPGDGGVAGCGDDTGLQSGTPWPMFRGCVRRIGRVGIQGPVNPLESVKWKFSRTTTVPQAPDGSPVVDRNGEIYITDGAGTLHAVDPSGSKDSWTYPVGAAAWSTPAIAADGTVWVGGINGFYAFTPTGGPPICTFGAGKAYFASPVVDHNGTVYVGSDDTNAYAYVATPSCKQVWSSPLGTSGSSSPAIDPGGNIVLGDDGGRVHVLASSDGHELWHYDVGQTIYSAPAIDATGAIYIIANDGQLVVVDPGTHGLKWNIPGPDGGTGGTPVAPSPAIGQGGVVYYGTFDGKLLAVDPGTRAVAWTYPVGARVLSSVLVGVDGTLYFGAYDSNVYAVSSAGKLVWKVPTGGKVSSSPALGPDGTLFIGSDDGNLYAFGL